MKINTRVFGEIEVDEEKIIQFPDGIVGFADLKNAQWAKKIYAFGRLPID